MTYHNVMEDMKKNTPKIILYIYISIYVNKRLIFQY